MTLHQNTIKNNFLIIVKIIYKIFRGEKIMYYKTTYKSPLGILYLVSDEENLIGLWLEGQKYFLNRPGPSGKAKYESSDR